MATPQGNLPEAQRLAESNLANAEWQRDLAVAHYNLVFLARDGGDQEGFVDKLRKCCIVPKGMQQRGLHFDPKLAQAYQQLAEMFDANNVNDTV